jgi:hypothetical protein
MNVLTGAVLFVSAMGVIAGALVALVARRVHTGLVTMLDLWTTASLLRLPDDASWSAIGTVAGLVALRKVVASVLGRHRRAERSST